MEKGVRGRSEKQELRKRKYGIRGSKNYEAKRQK
jgi:hypothetical protein